MKILVCISNVPDTTTKIKFTGDNSDLDKSGVQWVINPWDELALTRALELKEANAGSIEKVTVINVGGVDAEPTIRKALAIGADDAFRINADSKDAYFIAAQIAEVVKNEPYDIILSGIESSDHNQSMVGGMLAEFLSLPSVSSVSFVGVENGEVQVKREIDGGKEEITTQIPFVGIVQKGITKEPRIPSMRGIMMARKKPLNVVEPIQIETLTEALDYKYPEPKGACKMIDPDNAGEVIKLLRNEAKIL